MVIYIAAENDASQPPSLEDLNEYAIEHNIGYPIVADPGWAVCGQAALNADDYIPSFHVLTPGPTWHTIDGAVSEGTFVPLLDQL